MSLQCAVSGYAGDEGLATVATFIAPRSLASDSGGLYIADSYVELVHV